MAAPQDSVHNVSLTLRGIMPTNGMTYQDAKLVTLTMVGDQAIISAIRVTGKAMNRQRMRNLVQDMFDKAQPIFLEGLRKDKSLAFMLHKLKHTIDWAKKLNNDHFNEFFVALVRARRA
ncbi:hypothetical protein GGR57DRAFT_517804 [Xylariaceae sp. FL1272]|nr:hypothetical protein GGR57DRAFT_517804 [Xylariaceae sp. FL1272]